jgi:hypothetical protein
MLKVIRECFSQEKILYSKHARDEMEFDGFGEIRDKDVHDAIMNGELIEDYPKDLPYPSCLIYGKTLGGRPLHLVCAYSAGDDIVIIVTVYQPHAERWIDFRRRKK